MTILDKISKNMKQSDIIVSVVLLSYILLDFKPPVSVAIFIDENILAQASIYALALGVFMHYHPIVGVLSLFAAHEIVKRSKVSTGGQAVFKYLPSQDKINNTLTALNDSFMNDITLEEELVSKMAPLVMDGPSSPPSYVPVLESTNATLLSEL